MKDLHPAARALIDAARGREAPFPSEVRARVHRSVLRRAVAVGAAVATTSTASAVSKAAALVAALTSPLAIPGVVGAVAGVAFLVLRAGAPAHAPPTSRPAAPTHVSAPNVPNRAPSIEAPPAIVPAAPPTASQEPSPAVPAVLALRAVPRATAPAAIAPVPAVEPADALESPGEAASVSGVRMAIAPTDLAEDLDRLRQVHEALRTGRSEAALSVLDRAGRRLEAGPLAEEAQVARVSALCQLGRAADARIATDRFLAAWPASPLAMRLRGGCAALGTNKKPEAD